MNIEEIRANAPSYATHYEIQDGSVIYYAQDTIGRWCYVGDDNNGWPARVADMDRIGEEAKPLY